MNRPSFFIVGAAQSGTRALYETLRTHPGLFLPPSGDLGYYWSNKDPFHFGGDFESDDALNSFEGAAEGAVCGTATAWQAFSEQMPTRIQEFAPRGKIILMLRPPISWMRDWHHDLLCGAQEKKVSFQQALIAEQEREKGNVMPKEPTLAAHLSYRKSAQFSEQIERYYQVFGKEQVFVGLMEDWEEKPESFLKELLEFLEVDSTVKLTVKAEEGAQVLPGTHHFDLAVDQFFGSLPGGVGLKKFFTKTGEAKYRGVAERLFAPMSDKKIPSVLEDELLEEFEPEVAKLGLLLGRDLSHWNEPRFPRTYHDHDHHH